MANDAQTVRYALPLTLAKIDGTVTVSMDASGTKIPVRTSEVTLVTEADRNNMHELQLDADRWTEREFELKLAADERLTGATHSSTGLGAEVVAAGLRVAAFAAKAAAIFAAGVAESALEPVPIDEVVEREQPELARRRKECTEAIDALQRKLLTLAGELTQDEPAADAKDALEAVESALAAMRAEAKLLDAQFQEWRAERFPDHAMSYTYTIGVDRLPKRDRAEPEIRLTDAELGEGQVGEIFRTLGVAVVLVGDEDPSQHSDTFDDSGVRYRLPRRCEVAVYEVPDVEIEGGQSAPLELRRVTPAWIVDADSELGFVRLLSNVFEQHGAGVEFGDTGTLSHLTNKHTGVASQVTTAVSRAGGQVVESLDQAAKTAAAFPSAPDPALKALQDQVAREELKAKLATARKTIAAAGDRSKPSG